MQTAEKHLALVSLCN